MVLIVLAAGGGGLSTSSVSAAAPGRLEHNTKKATITVATLPPATTQKHVKKPKKGSEDEDIPPVSAGPQVPVGTSSRSTPGGTTSAGVAAPSTAALTGGSAGASIELEQFDGALYDGPTPPDNGFGVGPSHVVQFVNGQGHIYDRTTAHTEVSTFNLSTFFGVPVVPANIPNASYSDPRVLYDAQSGRWYAAILIFDGCTNSCATASNSEIDVAVSWSSDPTGNWSVYPVGTNYSNQLLDQPKLGVSNDKAVLTWNITGFAGPYQFVEVQKSDLVAHAGSVSVFSFATDSTHYNVIPVVTLGNISTEYAASINRGGSTLTVFEFTGTPNSSPNVTTHDFAVGTVNDPPSADQSGDPRQLDTGTAGEQSAVWQSGTLWSAGNTACTPPGDTVVRACLSFHRVNTGSWSLVTDTSVGQNGAHLFYPSVMVDSAGNLFAGHSVSSSGQFGTAGMTYFAGGTIAASNPGFDYKVGLGSYNCTYCYNAAIPPAGPTPSRNRWGDYSGAAQDPNNPKDVWLSEEFATYNTASTNNWAVEIARFTASVPVISSLIPNHAPELAATCAPSVTITGTDFQLGATVKFGSVVASSTVSTPELLQATAPAQAAGSVNVTVTTPVGTSSSTATFTYDPDNQAPVTVPSLTTPANGNGWNKAPFTVNFNATDGPSPCGSGVKDVTVDSVGAVTSGPTTTSGGSTSLFIGTEGITTIHYHATDNAGNVEGTHTLIVRLDLTDPTVNCGSPDGLWHASNVSIACTASDTPSGLANPADASFSLSTSVPAGTETATAFTNSYAVLDRADRSTTVGPLGPIMVDRKPPVITITTPVNNGTYIINQPVAANFGCTDGGSGVDTCVGTVANGSNINTSSVGTKTFTVNASDNVGNASTLTVTYYVTYKVCLLYDPTQPFARNNQAPIKLEICDYNDVNLSSASITLHAVSVSPSVPGAPSSNSNPGNNFRFDATIAPGGGYIYNLIVKTFPPGNYNLNFTATGDPGNHQAPFKVK
ncbi:MAG: IPT/TIG domain-containing protein [Tepidiformaceae bacterium]